MLKFIALNAKQHCSWAAMAPLLPKGELPVWAVCQIEGWLDRLDKARGMNA